MVRPEPRPRSRFLITTTIVAAATVGALSFGAVRFARRNHAAAGSDRGGEQAALTLALALKPGSTASYVGYVVKSSSGNVLTTGSIAVTDPKAALSADVVLPPGKGHVVTVFSSTNDDGRRADWHIGTRTFDVVPGQNPRLDFGTVTVGTPSGAASAPRRLDDTTTAANSAGTATGALSKTSGDDAKSSCQACEFAKEQGKCDPDFLSARSESPPSWGCDTLLTPRERVACAALLHCLNVADCAREGSPFLRCFCGASPLQACLAGQGVTGDCMAQYADAAETSGGPAKGAPVADLARYLAQMGTNPRNPVGLADNIKECAVLAHCEVCNDL